MNIVNIKENSKIKICRATPNDAYNIKKIHIETYQESYRGFVPDEYLDNMVLDDDVIERTKKYLETAECWLTFYQENPAAFAYVSYPEDDVFEINALYVHPKYQKCHIGFALINYLCEDKKRQGLSRCVVWTMKFGPSIPFYQKMNFRQTNEEKTWKFNIPIIKLKKEF